MTTFELIMILLAFVMAVIGVTYIWVGDSYAFGFTENVILGAITAQTLFSLYAGLKSTSFDYITSGRNLSLIVPLILGFLAFARFTRYRWAARYNIATVSGIGVGVTFGLTIRSWILDAVRLPIANLIQGSPDYASAALMFFGIIVVVYFMYSTKLSTPFHAGKLRPLMRVGRIFLYISFGYMYSEVFTTESIHSLTTFGVNIVRRTIQALTGWP